MEPRHTAMPPRGSITPRRPPIVVRPVSAHQTYALRRDVLWPNKPLAYVQLPDDETGQHFGAFISRGPAINNPGQDNDSSTSGSKDNDKDSDCGSGEELVSIISLFIDDRSGEARFRKFATARAWQGRGVGSELLAYIIEAAASKGATKIWCDARESALGFYQRFGFGGEGELFFKGEVPYLRMSKALP
ncbi:GCN5-like N-acetyltransferase [Annulohypoxylon bovei var. microspora]|nr:GCN5-like N-acetyltransferase [Annulohypoxylon bovei var. microspora]